MRIGEVDGHDVIYNKDNGTVTCKDITVLATSLVEAYESSIDRVNVASSSDTNLVMRKFGDEITLGCFKFTPERAQFLIKLIKRNARNQKAC